MTGFYKSKKCLTLSHFMNPEDRKDPKNWTQEEKDRYVAVFKWLLEQDRKQNPHLYAKRTTLEKGQNKAQKDLE